MQERCIENYCFSITLENIAPLGVLNKKIKTIIIALFTVYIILHAIPDTVTITFHYRMWYELHLLAKICNCSTSVHSILFMFNF